MRSSDWSSDVCSSDLAIISLSEVEVGVQDQNGADIYLDIPLSKEQLDKLIEAKLTDSIESVRETMAKARLSSQDVDRVVLDRKSVVVGEGVSVRVDLGGRRNIRKKRHKKTKEE